MQKRALVVGGAGIRGSRFLESLIREGYIVYSLDKKPSGIPSAKVVNIFCELKNENSLKNILCSHYFDCVVDAASKTGHDAARIYNLLNKNRLQKYVYSNPHRYIRSV